MSILDKNREDKILFSITESYLQSEAQEKIGRELNDDELHIANKAIESALDPAIDIILHTIFTEMIPVQKNPDIKHK